MEAYNRPGHKENHPAAHPNKNRIKYTNIVVKEFFGAIQVRS